jgi:hypothetical protein
MAYSRGTVFGGGISSQLSGPNLALIAQGNPTGGF